MFTFFALLFIDAAYWGLNIIAAYEGQVCGFLTYTA